MVKMVKMYHYSASGLIPAMSYPQPLLHAFPVYNTTNTILTMPQNILKYALYCFTVSFRENFKITKSFILIQVWVLHS